MAIEKRRAKHYLYLGEVDCFIFLMMVFKTKYLVKIIHMT